MTGMVNVTEVSRMKKHEGRRDEYLTRLKNENILLSEFLKDTMDLACGLCRSIRNNDVCDLCRVTKYKQMTECEQHGKA